MANHYKFDAFGRFDGVSATATERSTIVAPAIASPDYNWNGVDWVYAPNVQTAPAAISQPAPPPASRTLTRLQYMGRFTDGELAAIYTAAKSVVQIEVWLEKFKLAEFVDLDDPLTLAGLQGMEAAGLIGAGRAAEILGE